MKIITQEQKEKIKQLHKEKLSYKEISDKTEVSTKTIAKIIRELETENNSLHVQTKEVHVIPNEENIANPITSSVNKDINNVKVKFELCCDTIQTVIKEGLLSKEWIDEKLGVYELITLDDAEDWAESRAELEVNDFKKEHSLDVFSDDELKIICPEFIKCWNWLISRGVKITDALHYFEAIFKIKSRLNVLRSEEEWLKENIESLKLSLENKKRVFQEELSRLENSFEAQKNALISKYQFLELFNQAINEEERKALEFSGIQKEIDSLRQMMHA